jgi:hypothetical protein
VKKIVIILTILLCVFFFLQSPVSMVWGKSAGQTVPTLAPTRSPTSVSTSTNLPTAVNSSTKSPTHTPTRRLTATRTAIVTWIIPSATPSPAITLIEAAATLTSSPEPTTTFIPETSLTSVAITEEPVTAQALTTKETGVASPTPTIVVADLSKDLTYPLIWLFPCLGSVFLAAIFFLVRMFFRNKNKAA